MTSDRFGVRVLARGHGQERLDDVEEAVPVGPQRSYVRLAGEKDELLVLVRQQGEEVEQVLLGGDPVMLSAHDQHGALDLPGVHHGQVRAHIEVGTGGHRVPEGQLRIGQGIGHRRVRQARIYRG